MHLPRRPLAGLALSLAVAAAATACGPRDVPFVDRATQAVFDPASADYWSMPFPHDLRLARDGTPGLSSWPGAYENTLVEMWLETADERLRGFGLTTGVFLPISGDLDPESLPGDPAASVAEGASVFLVDVDPDSPERGRRFPLNVTWLAEGDRWSPDRLLAAAPVFGFVRRPATTYALVITDAVRDTGGAPLGRSPAFHDAFEDRPGAHGGAAGLLSPLRAGLEAVGVDTASVVAAVPFTTVDPNAELLAMAAWAETLPTPTLASPWVVDEAYESFQVLTATFEVPTVQSGSRPYRNAGEGLILWGDDDGLPRIVGTQAVRLVLTVPRSAKPEGGFPITISAHGSGGDAWMSVHRGARDEVPADEQEPADPGRGPAEWLARRGIATIGLDFNIHGTRHSPPDTTGLVFYNLFGNVAATLDNFTVAAGLELPLLSRLLTEMTVDAALADTLDAGDAADGLIRFDPENIFALGQSMGSTLTIPWATVDPRVKALVFSGAGGMLVEIAVTAVEPVPLRELLEVFVDLDSDKSLHIAHPLLHAMQNLWDLADPVAKARHVAAEPHPGVPPKSFLMPTGVVDGYFHPRAQTAVAVALGADLAGEPVEPVLVDGLALDGRTPVSYPVSGNLNGRTGVATHFEAPHTLGHYVTFNQARVKHQYTCFLASGGTVVSAPEDDALAPCP
jgi:hypothetical protein